MKLYIVRHGETYGNINGDGFSETDLTPRGEKQIFLLGERFKDEKIDRFYTSPLIRAVKTTLAVKAHHPNTKITIDSLLLEKGTDPDYCGLPQNDLLKLCPDAEIGNLSPLGTETNQEAYVRATKIIKKIKEENPFDSTVMIIAHGTFNNFLVMAATGIPLIENFNFSHVNTGVSLVRYVKENGKIQAKLKYGNSFYHLLDDPPEL